MNLHMHTYMLFGNEVDEFLLRWLASVSCTMGVRIQAAITAEY